MIRANHIIAGLVAAEAILVYVGIPLNIEYLRYLLPDLFSKGPESGTAIYICTILIGTITGSILPDADIYWPRSMNLHRTILHWAPMYLLILVCSYYWQSILFCSFSIAALTHILLDSMTIVGVPLKKPFGKKHGFKLMRVGGSGEIVAFILLIGIGVGIYARQG